MAGPGRLLDVGCGAGQFLDVARARGWAAEGTEISSSAVRFLEERGHVVHSCPLPGLRVKPYRAITMFEVLEHVRDPWDYLRAARRLLVPGEPSTSPPRTSTASVGGCLAHAGACWPPSICPTCLGAR